MNQELHTGDIHQAVEYAVVGRAEEILGRVPGAQDYERHCRWSQFANRTVVWFWDDVPIVRLNPATTDAPIPVIEVLRE
jgi:hypothetical protein